MGLEPKALEDLARVAVDPALLRILPLDFMKKYAVLPLRMQGSRLALAAAEPVNPKAIDQVRAVTGCEIDMAVYPAAEIEKAMDRLFGATRAAYCEALVVGEDRDDIPQRLANRLFDLALQYRAADIHLEPQIGGLFVRFRVDGTLMNLHRFPRSEGDGVVAKIKSMALLGDGGGLPQDGRMMVTVGGKEMDVRVACMPCRYGEKLVVRVLDNSGGAVGFDQLGMGPDVQMKIEGMIEKTQGLVLVTGPAGSGKSLTLYAMLHRLKSATRNIVTLENSIKFDLLGGGGAEAGVTQTQIQPEIGLTFAAGLRASLRQDPDVIMVAEICDKETAEAAMQASLAGQLLLSTLHTFDAPSAIPRLRDFGVAIHLISSTVTGVVSQRLLRLLCRFCREPYRPPARALRKMFGNADIDANTTLHRPRGCTECQGTGYRGRVGIFEAMPITEEIRWLIQDNAPLAVVRKQALVQGMTGLAESGLDLVRQGLTTVEEVLRHAII